MSTEELSLGSRQISVSRGGRNDTGANIANNLSVLFNLIIDKCLSLPLFNEKIKGGCFVCIGVRLMKCNNIATRTCSFHVRSNYEFECFADEMLFFSRLPICQENAIEQSETFVSSGVKKGHYPKVKQNNLSANAKREPLNFFSLLSL